MKDDMISRQAAIELFKDDVAAVNELNNLPPLTDRMKYVQESVNTIMNTCKSDSIKDKAFRNAARLIQNAIDGEAPDFETIEELPSAQPGWIPVTEKPIEGGQYIVTLKDDKEVWTDIAEWNPTFGGRWQAEFFDCEYRDIDNVVAWMPLPKPWEGDANG